MSTYFIHESNLERLEKKLASLKKKCDQSHCNFKYEIKGETYKEYESAAGDKYTAKFYEVEVEGEAKYNGWRFVATLDHHEEGNVVRAFDTELVIPDKYKTCGPTCEHCNKIRSRKDTYLIFNEETQEFKQVGKSCLAEFTNGLSAENIAFFCSIYEAMESNYSYSGTSFTRYIEVESILRYAFEAVKHWGYQKSRNSFEHEDIPADYRSTRDRVVDYFYINRQMSLRKEALKDEMDEVGFNPDSEYAVKSAEDALNWIRNEEDLSSEYIRNLHIICSGEYAEYRDLGILVSLPVAYERHLGQIAEYEKKQKETELKQQTSNHMGEVGQKLTIECESFKCLSCWENQYGLTFLYQIVDKAGNIYKWFASKSVDEDNVRTVTGTVKDHSEYNGVKETILTRCKVTYAPAIEEELKPGTDTVQKALDDFFEYVNA